MENDKLRKSTLTFEQCVKWCEALFSGFSVFGFGRVGRICHWAGLADQGSDDLISQHMLELQESVQALSQDLFRLPYEDTAILF